MENEGLFRIALSLGIAVLFVVGGRYRLRSNASGERLDRRQEGWIILIGLRLTALVALIVLLTFLFAPERLAWCRMGLPDYVRWGGFGLAALSGCLKIWTFQSLGTNLTDTVVTRSDHTLVQHGPYRYIRHPFYTSFALDVIGVGCLTDRWLLLLLGGATLGMLVARTRREETHLVAKFGQSYQDYQENVGAYLPKVWGRRVD